MKFALAKLGLAGILAFGVAGCKNEQPTSKKDTTTTQSVYVPREPHYLTAFDNSNVLVIEHADKTFTFYRDKDGDGLADTVGHGGYMFDLSRIFDEHDICLEKDSMESLRKSYN